MPTNTNNHANTRCSNQFHSKMIKLQSILVRFLALTSSITEGVSSKLGANDNLYWLYKIINNSTEYRTTEQFFKSHTTWNIGLWWFPICTFITDFYFIGALFISGKLAKQSQINQTQYKCRCFKYYLAFAIAISSSLAEGLSSAPSLANTAYEWMSRCNNLTKTPYCASAENFIQQNPLLLLLITFLCLCRAWVDFQTEGFEFISSIARYTQNNKSDASQHRLLPG